MYNNISAKRRIFWIRTICPHLNRNRTLVSRYKAVKIRAKNISVRNFVMGEYDPNHGNKKGAVFYIDNFALFPSQEKNPFRFGWKKVYDATGIKTFAYKLSRNPKDTPDTACGHRTMMEIPAPGPEGYYFHLSAEDNNGNKSATSVMGPITLK